MTKANNLEYLASNLKKSMIDSFISFTVKDWYDDYNRILKRIINSKLEETLIIRSSALCEDNLNQTFAGAFKSVLNIPKEDEGSLISSINEILASYEEKHHFNPLNQIIIQNQLIDPKLSAVIFTRDPNTLSPYYTIEFDDTSGKTNLVTGFGNRKQIRIIKCMSSNVCYPWSLIIPAINEIEKLYAKRTIIIELALDQKDNIHMFQTRMLPMRKNHALRNLDRKFMETIRDSFEKLNKITRYNYFFSNMSDWNPAEMLGVNPRELSLSLYRFLITKDVWRDARSSIGYTDASPRELMFIISGKPYIDVESSLRSLTPALLSENLVDKLVKYQIKRLIRSPFLHDKIEFEIAYSCSDIEIPKRTSLLPKHRFKIEEIQEIQVSLTALTQNIFKNFSKILQESKNSLDEMKKIRNQYLQQDYFNEDLSLQEGLRFLSSLLTACKNLGVFPFARLARLAFICHDLILQLQKRGVLTHKFYQKFANSIKTIPSEINENYNLVKSGNINKEDFLRKYGHLRPGTYDITIPRYDQINFTILDFQRNKISNMKSNFVINSDIISKVEKVFKDSNLNIESIDFFNFVKQSIIWREKSKFEFTKVISDSLELLAGLGKNLGFSRRELSNLNIFQILLDENFNHKDSEIKKVWKKVIRKNLKLKNAYDKVVLAPTFTSKVDLFYVKVLESKPNFVTNDVIEAPIIVIDKIPFKKLPDLYKKIVVIEAADPGYDWIFSKGIAGFITKYGGVASHMAVRCAEYRIPAAIGCGELIYSQIIGANNVRIDANEKKILIIN